MQLLCGMQWELICSGNKNEIEECTRFYAELSLSYDELRYNSTRSKAIEIEFARLHVPYCDNLIQCLISSNVTINVPVVMKVHRLELRCTLHNDRTLESALRSRLEVRCSHLPYKLLHFIFPPRSPSTQYAYIWINRRTNMFSCVHSW